MICKHKISSRQPCHFCGVYRKKCEVKATEMLQIFVQKGKEGVMAMVSSDDDSFEGFQDWDVNLASKKK